MPSATTLRYAAVAGCRGRDPLNLLFDLRLVGGEDLLNHVGRDLLVVTELNVEVCAAAGDGAKVAGVGEHLDLRHLGLDDLPLAALLDAHWTPPPAREVAHNIANELGGREDLHLDVWL